MSGYLEDAYDIIFGCDGIKAGGVLEEMVNRGWSDGCARDSIKYLVEKGHVEYRNCDGGNKLFVRKDPTT